MTAPLVDTLPTAPSKLARPNTFSTESIIFLEKLPYFQTQINSFNSYINSIIFNGDNLGTLNGLRSLPGISNNSLNIPTYSDNTYTFVDDIDALYAKLKDHSTSVNTVGIWVDTLVKEVGTIASDTNKPIITNISAPMTKSQSISDFNSYANNFNITSINSMKSLYASISYSFNLCCSNRDYGLVTNSITTTIDNGNI